MRGWFDAFRTEGGPTLYSYSNRTPVTGDLPTITLYIVFFTLFIAFLIIFPGVRKERFATFTSVTLSLFVGTVILVTNQGSCWHVSESLIKSDYRSFSTEKLEARIGVYIGLKHVNVTLESENIFYERIPPFNENNSRSLGGNGNFLVDYNERFHWDGADQISHELKEALFKGLPYPILTVLEYFSLDDEGFSWGRMYRLAGYYTSILLWASFASWLLMNLLLVVVPRYGAYQMVITGLLMLSASSIYYVLLPQHPLLIRFEQHILTFQFGWSFWLVSIAGSLCGFVGLIISFVDLMYPHTFSTILEVDYDTPYDRHIIIEESHKGKGRRSLEDPDSGNLMKQIKRTLSKRGLGSEKSNGLVNGAFELDPPKSPWANYNRMVHQKRLEADGSGLVSAMAKNPGLARLAAPNHLIMGHDVKNFKVKSPKSVSFRRQSNVDLKKRPDLDDDDDDDDECCSSASETQPCDNNLHHFQGSKVDVNDLNVLALSDVAALPKPRLIPRASYDSNHSSNSRRASNESSRSSRSHSSDNSDNHSHSSSLSGFSSNSNNRFDNGSTKQLTPEHTVAGVRRSNPPTTSTTTTEGFITTTRNLTANTTNNNNNTTINVTPKIDKPDDEW